MGFNQNVLPYAPESFDYVFRETLSSNHCLCVCVEQIHASPEAEGHYGGTGGVSTQGQRESGRGNSQEHSYPGREPQFERRSRQVRDAFYQQNTQ